MSTWVTEDAWAEAVAGMEDDQPWPGPRPLGLADGIEALRGRSDDLARFRDLILTKRFIQLTGVSGVGKSSMLYAGLIPDLRRFHTVAYCNKWNIDPGETLEDYLGKQLHDSLPDEQRALFTDDRTFFGQIDGDLGSGAILVFDQFEEVLRQDADGPIALDFIYALLTRFRLKVILSYRSEYSYVVRPLEAQNHNQWTAAALELPPIADDQALEIITIPTGRAGTVETIITDEAATLLHELWCAARLTSTRQEIAVGPLHLQAALWALWRSRSGGAGSVGLDTVRGFFETAYVESMGLLDIDDISAGNAPWAASRSVEAEPAVAQSLVAAIRGTGGVPGGRRLTPMQRRAVEVYRSLFDHALRESAMKRIDVAREAADACGMDKYLSEGIALRLAETVPHLSSGTYKLERDVVELAQQVLAYNIGRIDNPKAGDRGAAALVDVLVRSTALRSKILSSTRSEIVDLPKVADAVAEVAKKARCDASDVGSGPMSRLPALDVLLEEVRRFNWALVWLERMHLARTIDSSERTTLALIHDGLGKALARWSDGYREDNGTWSVHALTAPAGMAHLWESGTERVALAGTADRPAVHLNLNMKGNSIEDAVIRNAVFVNGDFRGTLFWGCTFDAVTFLNCSLDGAIFSDCTVDDQTKEGRPVDDLDQASEQPFYELTDEAVEISGLVDVLARYRESEVVRSVLAVQAPGKPAVPWERDDWAGVGALVKWVKPDNGLVIEGGQVSALTLRKLTFRNNGTVTFKYVRGSGIDVNELQPNGKDRVADGVTTPTFEFARCALRHVAFSTPPGEYEYTDGVEPEELRAAAVPEELSPLTVTVKDSAIAQWWIGKGIAGDANVIRSSVGQFWVESPAVTAVVAQARAVGLTGVKVEKESVTILPWPDAMNDEGLAVTDQVHADKFRSRLRRMDYRRS